MAANVPQFLLKRPATVLFTVTLLVRLWILGNLTDSPYFSPDSDAKFYQDWAIRILQGKFSDGQSLYGLPGYAWLLAGTYKLLGINAFFPAILQAVAEGFLSVLILKISNLINKEGSAGVAPGLVAGLGYAFFVPAQAFSIVLMPTSLLVLTYWFVVWWSLETRENGAACWQVAGLGLLVGGMAMVVATILFALPLAVSAIFLARQRTSNRGAALRVGLLMTAVVAGCSPAILYNRLVAKDSVLLSAHSGVNFYAGNQEGANGYLRVPDGLRASQAGMLADSISVANTALGGSAEHPVKRSAVSKYWSEKAKEYIRQHPAAWLRLEGQKVLNFWNAHQYDDLSLINQLAEAGITTPGLRFGLVSALGLAGMLSSFFCLPRTRWVTAAVLLHMAALLPVFITERYRMAAVPGLLILGALWSFRLWQALAGGQWRQSALLSCLGGASTLFVTLPSPDWMAWPVQAYNTGITAMEHGDLATAEAKLKLAWRFAPDSAEFNFAIANLYLKKNEPQRAKEFYRRTIELDARHSGAWNNLGGIALDQLMPASAIIFFQKSLAAEPDDAKTRYLLARAYWENKQPKEAAEAIHRALTLSPDEKIFQELLLKIEDQAPTNPATPQP